MNVIKPVCFTNNCHELVFDAMVSKAKPEETTTFIKNGCILLVVASMYTYTQTASTFSVNTPIASGFTFGSKPVERAAQRDQNKNILNLVYYKSGLGNFNHLKKVSIDYSPRNATFITFNRNLYIFGEKNVKIDVENFQSIGLPEMNIKRTNYAVIELNGLIYAIGGLQDKIYFDTVER